jgi:hypothetical protein
MSGICWTGADILTPTYNMLAKAWIPPRPVLRGKWAEGREEGVMGEGRGARGEGTRECEGVSSAAPSRVWDCRCTALRDAGRSPMAGALGREAPEERGRLRVPTELCTHLGAWECGEEGVR